MSKFFNVISIISGIAGGLLTYFFGDFDVLLKALGALVILDYITGFIKAGYKKELSSNIGFKGFVKKILIFIIVAVAVIIQRLMNDTIPLREIVLFFFVCNEGLSIIENASEFIPIPQKLRDVLLQIRDKGETDNESD